MRAFAIACVAIATACAADPKEAPSLDPADAGPRAAFEPPVDAAPPSDAAPPPDAVPLPECVRDVECGSLEHCFEQRCVYNPTGLAFRLASIAVEGDGQRGLAILGQVLQPLIDAEGFNLIVYFPPGPTGELPGRELDACVVHGQRSGTEGVLVAFRQTPELPSFCAPATWAGGGAEQYAYDLIPFVDETFGRLDLWLADPSADDACRYHRLVVSARLRIDLTEVPGGEPGARAQVSGILRRRDAADYTVTYNGQTLNLAQLLEAAGAPVDADADGDGTNDGWAIAFGGDARRVALQGNPASNIGVEPPGCGDD